jgi:lipopolysaccharide transport system ATP-binding protein
MKPNSHDVAISVRDLKKHYSIVQHAREKHSTLAETLLDRMRNPFRREHHTTFRALDDLSFDVQKGEVVGVIGRNGAGKSTLLKILSRITEPTSGEIALYGRVGSLLEVGTGFHPELTGRENIYLNGSMLGMNRAEITKQFDAIVDFAGVEKFLDTPVKRYSSGMYVRLAFAVAAHLRSEILIVDEVLAVGDAEFQKKCLGRMKELSSDGRTVLFVSHQMQAVSALCTRGMLLDAGRVVYYGNVDETIKSYLDRREKVGDGRRKTQTGRKSSGVTIARLTTSQSMYLSTDDIEIEVEIECDSAAEPTYFLSLMVFNQMGVLVTHLDSRLLKQEYETTRSRLLRSRIRGMRLVQGDYTINAYLCAVGGILDTWEGAGEFSIGPLLPYPDSGSFTFHSIVYPDFLIEEANCV